MTGAWGVGCPGCRILRGAIGVCGWPASSVTEQQQPAPAPLRPSPTFLQLLLLLVLTWPASLLPSSGSICLAASLPPRASGSRGRKGDGWAHLPACPAARSTMPGHEDERLPYQAPGILNHGVMQPLICTLTRAKPQSYFLSEHEQTHQRLALGAILM